MKLFKEVKHGRRSLLTKL